MNMATDILPREPQASDPAYNDGGSSGVDTFLSLLSNPFQSQIQQTSMFAALGWGIGIMLFGVVIFCLLRPRVSTIYAPRAKYADEKHAPPPVGRGFLSWIAPIKSAKETELIEKIGLDATIFLRFLRMCRNIFVILAVLGCAVMIPVNLVGSHGYESYGSVSILMRFTPQFIFGPRFWAFVIMAYVFNIVIGYFLWHNYAVITKFRRAYFESADYRASLHSRTLLITQIPSSSRTDDGIINLVEEAKPTQGVPKAAIARNVKDLPELISDYENAVEELENHLAKYLRDPNKLGATRPVCKPSKHDKAHKGDRKVDAIEYYTSRIRELETEIRQVRMNLDKRNPLPYGFASYTHIEDAHAVAYAARKKGPYGTDVRLAPRPSDLLWKNLAMTPAQRRVKSFWNGFGLVLLTIVYIVPNALTAIFLADLSHLGQLWPAFNTVLLAHPTLFAVLQAILAPGLQNLFYLALPTIFRRALARSGDRTKTSRERHVHNKLYAFQVFNNLIVFTTFSAAWQFVSSLVKAEKGTTWQTFKQEHPVDNLSLALCNVSPYWVTWILSKGWSIATDILHWWTLFTSTLSKRFGSPTPRQLIELTAPQPFIYAEYYSQYIFVFTVALCFATVQPIILPMTAAYLAIDSWMKKYSLQYIFITKTESGGGFWRVIFNRILFAVLLGDCTIALIVWARGYNYIMLACMIPLPFMIAGFKWFTARTFDTQFNFYSTDPYGDLEMRQGTSTALNSKRDSLASDRVGVRFGHPALYKRLITPMVNARVKHLLPQVYRGRLEGELDGTDAQSVMGYSDIYMDEMSVGKPGKSGVSGAPLPFEMVAESECDFENFKRRSEFAQQFGGEGQLYGRQEDGLSTRPGTPGSSMMNFGGTKGSAYHDRMQSDSSHGLGSRGQSPSREAGTVYPRGYHAATGSGASNLAIGDISTQTHYQDDVADSASISRGRLIDRAAGMGYRGDSPSSTLTGGVMTTPGHDLTTPGAHGGLSEYFTRGAGAGTGGGNRSRGQYHYMNEGEAVTGGFGSGRATPTEDDEQTSYDYFRRGRGAAGPGIGGRG